MSILSPARRSAVDRTTPRRPRLRGDMRDLPLAIAFILPATIGFGVFLVWPSIRGIWLSFTDYSVFQPGKFIGLENYRRMFVDPVFWASMRTTVYYVVVNIAVQTLVALLLAVLLSRLTKSMVMRGIILTPYLVSNVVTALLWLLLLDYQLGIVNELLDWVGIGRQSFWGNPTLVVPTIAMVNVWRHVGYTALLIFAGLQSIPPQLYEAASIDGASKWQIFWDVIVPLSRPGLITLAIFAFLGNYGGLIWPLVMVKSEYLRTLPVGMMFFDTQYGRQTNLIMAGSVLAVIPPLILFIAGQKFLVKGIQLGAVKG